MKAPFETEDTIAAISTPPGPGAIGMVRLSGPGSRAVARKIFTPASGLNGPFPPRKAIFGRVHEPGSGKDPIDLGILCFFEAPGSYTGEDTVEITTHGGTLVLQALLGASIKGGARLAQPGEFTRRAFLNGRMDLSQAEAVASLIFASTEEARKVMLRQVEGAMAEEAGRMRRLLLEMKALLEASIDFPEETHSASEHLITLASEVLRLVKRLRGTAEKGIALKEGIRVVIAGAPNVGKSCLLNALLQEERAIVHEIPGTTRDYLESTATIGGMPARIVDTAGIRTVEDPVEHEGVRKTRHLMSKADALILVVDTSRPLTSEEEGLLEETSGLKRVIAANKIDLDPSPGFILPDGSVRVSALEGRGIEELRAAVRDVLAGGLPELDMENAVVTTTRQAGALDGIGKGCHDALGIIREEGPPELIALCVEEAILSLAELTGEITTEDVLGEIFSRFCIGK